MTANDFGSVAGVCIAVAVALTASAACVDVKLPDAIDRDGSAIVDDGGVETSHDASAGQGGAILLAPPPGMLAPINLASVVIGMDETIDLSSIVVDPGADGSIEWSARFGSIDDPRYTK